MRAALQQRLAHRRGPIACRQDTPDHIETAAEFAQFDESQQVGRLRVGVVAIACAIVDVRRRHDADRVVVTQHPHAHPPDRGEVSDGVHGGVHVRP